jgi:Cupin superfamily protein
LVSSTSSAIALSFVALLRHEVDAFVVDKRTHPGTSARHLSVVRPLTERILSDDGIDTPSIDDARTNTGSSTAASPQVSTVQFQELEGKVLQAVSSLRGESLEYAEMLGLGSSDAAMYALFKAIRTVPVPLNLKGAPFVLRNQQLAEALQCETGWRGFFTMKDLEKAVADDFLDAARGSTDNRRGWKITDVSQPRGESFHEARMTYEDVVTALGRGTVIFNAAGAHVPKLAGPTLAAADGALASCALNLYVTQQAMRTSAPPHTDKQDVVVVQSTGQKHWRVYSPPDPSVNPNADPFGRGKGDDSLPLYSLQDQYGCELLLEAVLNPGDALFVPAGFPHTTSTVVDATEPRNEEADGLVDAPSIHLTLGIDHHIWELDYLCARRLGLRRAGIVDTALGQVRDEDNPYAGKVNELPQQVWKGLLAELPLGLLDDENKEAADECVREAAQTLDRLSREVDHNVASQVSDPKHWVDVAQRFQEEGRELLEIHRDMYLAAIEEGRKREMEEAMTSHLHDPTKSSAAPVVMSPERMQRLSLFRVKRFYDRISESKAALKRWSYEGAALSTSQPTGGGAVGESGGLPADWATTMPVKVGDAVEADLGGAYFSAKVIRASSDNSSFDVQFFDGDVETGLPRPMIRLLSPPKLPGAADAAASPADPSKMTAKQLKRWKKQQEKLHSKSR